MLVIKQLMVPIDLHTTIDVNRDQQLFGFSNIFFGVQQKKETYTGMEGHGGK